MLISVGRASVPRLDRRKQRRPWLRASSCISSRRGTQKSGSSAIRGKTQAAGRRSATNKPLSPGLEGVKEAYCIFWRGSLWAAKAPNEVALVVEQQLSDAEGIGPNTHSSFYACQRGVCSSPPRALVAQLIHANLKVLRRTLIANFWIHHESQINNVALSGMCVCVCESCFHF